MVKTVKVLGTRSKQTLVPAAVVVAAVETVPQLVKRLHSQMGSSNRAEGLPAKVEMKATQRGRLMATGGTGGIVGS
jgi:hypothetical protein